MNIIAKGKPGAEYIITDMMATSLSRKDFLKIQELNIDKLGDYRYVPQNETDFGWWPRISKKLTRTKIKEAFFDCDIFGNVIEY